MTTAPSSKHILIAEDNDFNQEVAIELLTEAGYQVTAASNGQQLINKLIEKPRDHYHLILMDLEMPVLDGHGATIQIRQNSDFHHIPIIAFTAHTLEATRTRCAEEGMQDFLSKPFDPHILYATLEKWLGETVNSVEASLRDTDVAQNNTPLDLSLHTINTYRGLQLSGNNPELYLKLLRRFAESQTETLKQLHQFHSSKCGDTDFKRLMHTLKGLAGTIGAETLANCVEKFEVDYLESAGKTNNGESSSNDVQFIRVISNLLEQIIDELSAYFALTDGQEKSLKHSESREFDQVEMISVFLKLLESASVDAVDFFHTNFNQLQMILSAAELSTLSEAINNYEFENCTLILNSHATPH